MCPTGIAAVYTAEKCSLLADILLMISALQALAEGNTAKAVKCLPMELAPLQIDTTQLHTLASAVSCQNENDLQQVMDWPGPDSGSRQHLLNSRSAIVESACCSMSVLPEPPTSCCF